MRNLSSTALQAIYDNDTDEVFLVLITIDHSVLSEPIRVVANSENTTSRGDEYIAYPFDIQLPSDEESSPPRAQIVIDNVDREIVKSLRSITSPASFSIEVVLASDPDVIEASWYNFELRNVKGDVFQISGELTIEDVSSEPYPGDTFTPSKFRGLFA